MENKYAMQIHRNYENFKRAFEVLKINNEKAYIKSLKENKDEIEKMENLVNGK